VTAELTGAFYSAAVDHVRRRLRDRRPIYQEAESRLTDLLNGYLRWSASPEFRQPFHQSCDVYAVGPAASRCDQLKEPGKRAADVVVTIGGSVTCRKVAGGVGLVSDFGVVDDGKV